MQQNNISKKRFNELSFQWKSTLSNKFFFTSYVHYMQFLVVNVFKFLLQTKELNKNEAIKSIAFSRYYCPVELQIGLHVMSLNLSIVRIMIG